MLASIALPSAVATRRRQHTLEIGAGRQRHVQQPVGRAGRRRRVARRRHLDRQARAAAHQRVDHRAVAQLEPARAPRLADHDPRGVARAREGQDLLDHRTARHRHHLGAELGGQPHRLGEVGVLGLRQGGVTVGLDIERDQLGLEPVGGALGGAHGVGGTGAGIEADDHALAGRPRAGDGVLAHVAQHLVVDPLGGAPQRQLAQRREVARREIVAQRALRLLADIDLALAQPRHQVGRREVDQLDLVGGVDDAVGHGLAHADAGDARDHVVQALDVLDVQGRVDVDAGRQQLLDVEIALGMPAARGVGVGELVDQHRAPAGAAARRRDPSPRACGPCSRPSGAARPPARRAAPRSRRGRASRPRRPRRRRPRPCARRAADSIS